MILDTKRVIRVHIMAKLEYSLTAEHWHLISSTRSASPTAHALCAIVSLYHHSSLAQTAPLKCMSAFGESV